MQYERLGNYPIVNQADLLNLVSHANKPGDVRVGGDSMGKYTGMEIMCKLTSGGTLNKCFATGPKSSDSWRVVDGSANYTPVNLGSFTPSTGCTYSSNLLTADGTDDPTATQTVALKAGKYYFSGRGTAEGTAADHKAALVVVTGATDGELVSRILEAELHPTAAETATAGREEFLYSFELTADQNVVFELSVVDETGALDAGSAYVEIDLLQAM